MLSTTKEDPTSYSQLLSELGRAALDYAARGLTVFPCGPDDPTVVDPVARAKAAKKPACAHGFHDATTDPAVIARWWTENPRYNIGGVPASAGYVVADLDRKGGKDGVAAFEDLARQDLGHDPAETWTADTPSGGEHRWYRGAVEKDGSAGAVAPGVDVKARDGYVLLAPSAVNGRPYAWINEEWAAVPLPEWFQVRHLAATGRVHPVLEPREGRPAGGKVRLATYREVLSFIDPTFRGQRGSFVGIMNFIIDNRATLLLEPEQEAPDGEELAVQWAKGDLWRARTGDADFDVATFDYADDVACLDAVRSRRSAGSLIRWGTLVHHANQGGYQGRLDDSPASEVFKDAIARPPANDEALLACGERIPHSPAGISADAWAKSWAKLGYHTHIEGRQRRPSVYWPGTHLPKATEEGIVGLITAQSGGGKTTMVGFQAMAVVKAGGRVVYFPGEGRLGLDTKRIPAWQAAYGVSDDIMLANWRTADHIPNLTSPADIAVAVHRHAAWLIETGGIAVFDTLKSATPGVEENSSAMGDHLASEGAIRRFADAARCTALVPHHIGKDAGKNSRGHSSIEGNADFVQDVKWNKEAGALELVHRKDRDGEDGFSTHHRTFAGLEGVPIVANVSHATFLTLKPSAAGARFEEVRMALDTLFAGQLGQGPVSSEVLALQIVTQREEARAAKARDRGEQVEPLATDEADKRADNVKKHLLNAYSKPDDGAKAELYDFAVKDDSGRVVVGSKGERTWRPAPVKAPEVTRSIALDGRSEGIVA
jgi:Bifunctional DNA primase/polymerase, N-terminal/AAA domain